MLSAPLLAKQGGEDRDRSDRSERNDKSDRDRDERDNDRSDDRDRDVADRDTDSSGRGSGETTDDSDRSERDDDDSGSGTSGSSQDDDDRDDSSGSGKSGSDEDDDTSGSSTDSDVVARDGDRAPYAVWRNERGDRVRSGEVIFMSARRDGASRVRAAGLHVIEEHRLSAIRVRMIRVAVPKGRSEEDVIENLQSIDPKGTATFNHIYEPAGRPALPVVLAAAKPSRIKPTKAKIGLVDAGVAASHQMLAQVKITQRQFGDGSKHDVQHGTAVASRLAAAAPGASILAANVFTEMRNGREIASAYAIARALDWLSRQQVAVINLSLAGPANPVLEEITKRMIDKGHVLVAAVGNEGPRGAMQYPAAYDRVVGVTAVDTNHRVYIYANQGDSVDFAAIGVDAPAATSTASVEAVSGTSYAAPIVAAAFARRLALPNAKQALAVFNTLRRRARDLGAPGRDPVYGHGLIDVAQDSSAKRSVRVR